MHLQQSLAGVRKDILKKKKELDRIFLARASANAQTSLEKLAAMPSWGGAVDESEDVASESSQLLSAVGRLNTPEGRLQMTGSTSLLSCTAAGRLHTKGFARVGDTPSS